MSSVRIMPKVRLLRDDMRSKGWHITAFLFSYNKQDYIVLFEDAKNVGCKDQYTIAYITFIDRVDPGRRLSLSANTMGFDRVNAKRMMDFFGVHNVPSLRGFFLGFEELLNAEMPSEYQNPRENDILKEVATCLGKRNNDLNPNGRYCYSVRRNPIVNGQQKHRTVFNANKARLFCPDLYATFGKDDTISFYFSPNASDAKDYGEIISEFAEREARIR